MSSDKAGLIPNEEAADYGTGGAETIQSTEEVFPAVSTDSGLTNTPWVTGDEKMTVTLFLLTMMSVIGGFLFGYDTGVISGAMISIRDKFELDNFWQELIVSSAIGAAAISAFAGGILNDWLGRKPVILIASFIFTVGAIVMGIADSKYILLVGRIIVGLGIGLASMTVPVYIAESAPSHMRGKLVLCNNIFITGGQFVASVIDGIFYEIEDGWRYMVGLAAVPSLIQFIGFLFMPESPRWLVAQRRHTDAVASLARIRGGISDQVRSEVEEIEMAHSESLRMSHSATKRPILIHMITQPSTRRALIVGCGLQMFQQIAGINTVMYYSATIIKMSGVRDKKLAVWLACATAGVNTLASCIGLYLVERVGRRKLTLGSLTSVLVSLVVLAVGFQLSAIYSPAVTVHENYNATYSGGKCSSFSACEGCINAKINELRCGFCFDEIDGRVSNGSCLPTFQYAENSTYGRCLNSTATVSNPVFATDYCPTKFAWMTTFGLFLYLICFSPGMGPMPWTINAEIYPLWGRSTGNAAATTTNWLFNLIVSITFLTLTDVLTKYGTYWLYSGLVVIGIAFIALFVPETKGKTLEQIEESFKKPFW